MPSKSAKQHRLMEAAAHTKGGYGGVPQKVGKDFVAADKKYNVGKGANPDHKFYGGPRSTAPVHGLPRGAGGTVGHSLANGNRPGAFNHRPVGAVVPSVVPKPRGPARSAGPGKMPKC